MLKAFDKLIPYAYKADLARYLLLYKLGGWYFDISVRLINGGEISDDVDFIVFMDLPQYSRASFSCCNGVMYAKRNSPILASTIEEVYYNIKEENYGRSWLYPTGPICLGKNVVKHFDDLNIVTGTFMALTPEFSYQNRAFVFSSGIIFGFHKLGNLGGDLAYLGVNGTNNYVKLYEQRNIYDRSIILD